LNQKTLAELETALGENLKQLRLSRNTDQHTLAEQAGVSTRALQSLENGEGSSLQTLLKVLRALGRESWLDTIAPVATINPMAMVAKAAPRQRARRKVNKP
jgi:transcriptional regulator with XRE-family HTH domain